MANFKRLHYTWCCMWILIREITNAPPRLSNKLLEQFVGLNLSNTISKINKNHINIIYTITKEWGYKSHFIISVFSGIMVTACMQKSFISTAD